MAGYTFQDRAGKTHTTKRHIMTFKGKHNSAVVKLLLVLNEHQGTPLSLKQLHQKSGIPYNTLKTRLGFWASIRYVECSRVDPPAGKSYYVYQIGDRGNHVLNNRIPAAVKIKYGQEITAWRRNGGHKTENDRP